MLKLITFTPASKIEYYNRIKIQKKTSNKIATKTTQHTHTNTCKTQYNETTTAKTVIFPIQLVFIHQTNSKTKQNKQKNNNKY